MIRKRGEPRGKTNQEIEGVERSSGLGTGHLLHGLGTGHLLHSQGAGHLLHSDDQAALANIPTLLQQVGGQGGGLNHPHDGDVSGVGHGHGTGRHLHGDGQAGHLLHSDVSGVGLGTGHLLHNDGWAGHPLHSEGQAGHTDRPTLLQQVGGHSAGHLLHSDDG